MIYYECENDWNNYLQHAWSDNVPKEKVSEYNHQYYTKHKYKWLKKAAKKAYRGDYGNGEDRQKALGKDYAAVQHIVNKKYYNIDDGYKIKTKSGKSKSSSSKEKDKKWKPSSANQKSFVKQLTSAYKKSRKKK